MVGRGQYLGDWPTERGPCASRALGELRHWFNSWGNLEYEKSARLRQLLIAPTVVVSSQLASSFHRDWLIKVRPLVEEGALLFVEKDHWKSHAVDFNNLSGTWEPSDEEEAEVALLMSDETLPAASIEANDVSFQTMFEYSPMFRHLINGDVTPTALTKTDARLMRVLFHGHVVDRRVSRLSTLAQFPFPQFEANVDELVAVRRNSDSLHHCEKRSRRVWTLWRTSSLVRVALSKRQESSATTCRRRWKI